MTAPPPNDWTRGPAKWAAVILLGSASIYGMSWSILTRATPAPSPPPFPVAESHPAPTDPTPQSPAASASDAHQPPPALSDPPLNPAPSSPPPNNPIPPDPLPEPPTVVTPAAPTALPPSPPSTSPSIARKININTASAAELELLPGIGPALAARILNDRSTNGPFRTIEDLDRVKGIGPRTLEKLRPLVTTE